MGITDKMKKNMTDQSLFFLGLVLALTGAYNLFTENFLKNDFEQNHRLAKDSIAMVQKVFGNPKTKSPGEVSWRSLTMKAYLHDKQTIYTEDNTNISINLYDAGTITLGPNSLIVLSKEQNIPTIEFIRGSISGKIVKKIKVRHKKKSVQLSKKPIKVSLNANSAAEIAYPDEKGEEKVIKIAENHKKIIQPKMIKPKAKIKAADLKEDTIIKKSEAALVEQEKPLELEIPAIPEKDPPLLALQEEPKKLALAETPNLELQKQALLEAKEVLSNRFSQKAQGIYVDEFKSIELLELANEKTVIKIYKGDQLIEHNLTLPENKILTYSLKEIGGYKLKLFQDEKLIDTKKIYILDSKLLEKQLVTKKKYYFIEGESPPSIQPTKNRFIKITRNKLPIETTSEFTKGKYELTLNYHGRNKVLLHTIKHTFVVRQIKNSTIWPVTLLKIIKKGEPVLILKIGIVNFGRGLKLKYAGKSYSLKKNSIALPLANIENHDITLYSKIIKEDLETILFAHKGVKLSIPKIDDTDIKNEGSSAEGIKKLIKWKMDNFEKENTNFAYEFAEDDDFTKIILAGETKELEVLVSFPRVGKYFFRIKYINSFKQRSPYSDIEELDITESN
jgi:hypothetical protein